MTFLEIYEAVTRYCLEIDLSLDILCYYGAVATRLSASLLGLLVGQRGCFRLGLAALHSENWRRLAKAQYFHEWTTGSEGDIVVTMFGSKISHLLCIQWEESTISLARLTCLQLQAARYSKQCTETVYHWHGSTWSQSKYSLRRCPASYE